MNLLKVGKMTKIQARRYLEKVRWPNGPVCSHCGNGKKVYALKGGSTRPGVYTCATCRKQFTVTVGTVMHGSHLPIRKWLMAFSLMCSAKKGISGLQLQRHLNLGSYHTAWRMLKQIRMAMSNIEHGKTFEAIVEVDETYIGGKPRKKNRKEDDNEHHKRGRGTKKKPVIGIVDREKKKVYAKVSLPNKKGKKLSGNQILGILNEVCKKKTIVITDEFAGYNILSKTKHIHLRVDHTKEFVWNFVHTNNVESFWAILKRGIYGMYHHVSVKYLQDYVNEFCFRFNNRGGDMFDGVLKQATIDVSKKNDSGVLRSIDIF